MTRPQIAAALAAASLLVSGAAQAAPPKPAPLADIFAAFKGICHANAGDPQAQVRAATSAPYNLTPGEKSADGSQVFHGEYVAVSVRESGGQRFCMATAPVHGDPSTDAAKNLAEPLLGKPLDGGGDSGTVLWADPSKKDTTVYLYLVKPVGDMTIGAFAVGVSRQ